MVASRSGAVQLALSDQRRCFRPEMGYYRDQLASAEGDPAEYSGLLSEAEAELAKLHAY